MMCISVAHRVRLAGQPSGSTSYCTDLFVRNGADAGKIRPYGYCVDILILDLAPDTRLELLNDERPVTALLAYPFSVWQQI